MSILILATIAAASLFAAIIAADYALKMREENERLRNPTEVVIRQMAKEAK